MLPLDRTVLIKRGFTLLEIVLVMLIITVLVGLLLPVLANSRRTGYKAVALEQMRQLGIAITLYAEDHDGRFVPSTNYGADVDAPERLWHLSLLPYAKNRQIFVAPGTNGRFVDRWDARGWASIGLNSATAYDPEGCLEGEPDTTSCLGFTTAAFFEKTDRPAQTALLALTPNGPTEEEYRGYEFSPYNGIPNPENLVESTPLVSDTDLVQELLVLPGDLLKPVYAHYHADGEGNGQTPIVFADGHAKSYTANQIQKGRTGIIWRFR